MCEGGRRLTASFHRRQGCVSKTGDPPARSVTKTQGTSQSNAQARHGRARTDRAKQRQGTYIEDNDRVGRLEVDAQTTRASRQQEGKVIGSWGVEVCDRLLANVRGNSACICC